MARRWARWSLVLAGVLTLAQDRALAGPPDQVVRDAAGREVSRTRLNADGSCDRTLVNYGEGMAKTIVREGLSAQGQVTQRLVERFDAVGRLAQRKEVTVDSNGAERGKRLSYDYDADGRQRVTTEILK